MDLAARSLSLLIVLLLHFSQTSQANNNNNPLCTPSSCGVFTNISYPFRLKDDPVYCGEPDFEISCENDVASFRLNSQKYYVKDINYVNSTIRLVDASINKTDICSFPTYTYNLSYPQHYRYGDSFLFVAYFCGYHAPIKFISCPNPLKDSHSSLFTDITNDCDSSHPSSSRYAYVTAGHIKVHEFPPMCELDSTAVTSWPELSKDLIHLNNVNVSLSEIHQSLLYGFDLCFENGYTPHRMLWDKFMHLLLKGYSVVGLYGLIIVGFAVIFGGLIIVGFAVIFGISALRRYGHRYELTFTTVDFAHISISIMFSLGATRFFISFFIVWLLIRKFRRRNLSLFGEIESFLRSDNSLTPIRYSYSHIKKITKSFQEKLGEGGYGSVYKGKLKSGHDVAIKLLGKSGANDQDFMNEIATIGRIHHINVVNLVGYCAQGAKRALVYDFMPNGSLEKYLFCREKMNSLSWDTKFEIALGVARGIAYLHRGCDIQILHFDIKPHNILLDENFIPKISDFGLAKYFSTDKNTVTMTAARGTIGYVAPELISRSIGAISYKADVYSFGMLLMEIVSLKRDLIGNNDDSSQYFPCWIYDHINQGRDIEIGKDEGNTDNEEMRKVGRKMTIVALWCIQMNPDDRPSMNKVLEMLEGDIERLQIPNYPSQSTQIEVNMDESGITCSTDSVPFLHHGDASSCFEITIQD